VHLPGHHDRYELCSFLFVFSDYYVDLLIHTHWLHYYFGLRRSCVHFRVGALPLSAPAGHRIRHRISQREGERASSCSLGNRYSTESKKALQ